MRDIAPQDVGTPTNFTTMAIQEYNWQQPLTFLIIFFYLLFEAAATLRGLSSRVIRGLTRKLENFQSLNCNDKITHEN